MINHPSHYGGGENVYEVIKIIEHYKLNFCKGNVLKYLLRAGKKFDDKELEDLEKALWYLQREVDNVKNEKTEKLNKCLDGGVVFSDNMMYGHGAGADYIYAGAGADVITLTGFEDGSNTSITITA